jgi:hypothetical protein
VQAKKSKNTLKFSSPEPGGKFQQIRYRSSLGKEIQNCSNKGPDPLQRGDNHNNAKMGVVVEKFLLENHRARIAQICMKALWHCANSSLYKLWSLGVWRGHNREKLFYMHVYIGKIF